MADWGECKFHRISLSKDFFPCYHLTMVVFISKCCPVPIFGECHLRAKRDRRHLELHVAGGEAAERDPKGVGCMLVTKKGRDEARGKYFWSALPGTLLVRGASASPA